MREVTRQDLANAVERILPFASAEMMKERGLEDRALGDARRDHTDPGANFWQRRHKAEQRVRLLEQLAEALHGD